MKHDFKLKEKAISLRKRGFSFREISESLGVSKSTASLWLSGIKLSLKAKKRINKLSVSGRKKANRTNNNKKILENKEISERVEKYFKQINFSKDYLKIVCATLYWCEGAKNDGGVVFMNSDPEMIRYFLYSFRNAFSVNENKFRALIHLHEYHNLETQLEFWSNITKIPKAQFFKPYLKDNTGKNKKENYPGCISVRYYDKKVFKELVLVYKKLYKMRG